MSEHYFSENPKSKLKTKLVNANIRGENISLFLASGTFSSQRIDNGSRILAEYMKIKENDSVLDLGCGTGIIGLIAARLTKNEVVLTDINTRAVEITKQNALGFENIMVLQGDLYKPVKGKKFDVILINLPQLAGREICSKMIIQAKDYLNLGGSLQIVERHNRGGKYFESLMKDTFGNMDVLAKKGGFWVCKSVFSLSG